MHFAFRRGFGVIYRENLLLKIPKELANLWLLYRKYKHEKISDHHNKKQQMQVFKCRI